MSSTDWYFHQERGKTMGPIPLDEVKARIHDGRIRMFDLVYKEGDKGWRMALEHATLKKEFSAITLATLKDKPWVCLRRKSSEAMDFVTIGPFGEDQVHERLLSGELSYSDYIWKEGFPKWKRIGSVKEFNPRAPAGGKKSRASKSSLEGSLEAIPAEELLKSVARLERKRAAPAQEEIPPEALPPPVPPEKKIPEKKTPAKKPKLKPKPAARPVETTERPRATRLDWGIFVGLVVVLVVALWGISKRIARPVPSAPKPSVVAHAARPAPKLKPSSSAKRIELPPKKLEMHVQAEGDHHLKISIVSDASTKYPVEIQIVGVPGQITEGASYYHFLRYDPSRAPSLDVSSLTLPEGSFRVRARAGELKQEASVHLGQQNKSYWQAVKAARKLGAAQIWRERLKLFDLSHQVAVRLGKTRGGRRFSTKGLSLPKVTWRTGGRWALFDQWSELAAIVREARKNPSRELEARARKLQAQMATYSIWK